ncbi:hypothetical protein O6H91_Y128900 [Diphasiastrum complanatum]|nr:hypothetical protein O6H91_Y128900 [Diphasiastrum complanatum]
MGDQEFTGDQLAVVSDEVMGEASLPDVTKSVTLDQEGVESTLEPQGFEHSLEQQGFETPLEPQGFENSLEQQGYENSLEPQGFENALEQQGFENPVEESLVKEEEQPKPDDLSGSTSEEERLWGMVKANSADFNAWTLLIQETEKLENISKIRKVYDIFLAEFPLCYGYWKKYADHEARLGVQERIGEVYELAVRAVTYSVDIWMHYCSYAMEKIEDPEELRSFKQIASSRPLTELRTPEENAEAAASAAIVESALEVPEEGAEVPPGGEEIPRVEKLAGYNEAEELEKFIGLREALYKKAKEWDAKIREFETAIRRPYFHVKPLDDTQLANWHRYLDFIEKEGEYEKIVKLYERCLIACANYPEYWIRYVHKMEMDGSLEAANDALTRATLVFVKRRPEIHLFGARFKEQQGDINGARSEYELLSSEVAPGLLEAIVKHANFEKRQENTEGACYIYETAIEVEKSKEDPRALPLMFIQYIRFLDQVVGNSDKAREVLLSALERLPLSKVLWEAAIHFETCHSGEKQVHQLDALVEQATAPLRTDGSPGLNGADREEISNIFLEFLDVHGDVHAIQKAEARHRQLFPARKTNAESKKRPSPDSSVSDRAKVHKPYAGSHATAAPAPAGPQPYANGQAPWGGAYGPQAYPQQAQAWQQPPPQQVPQVQPQQWNAGYGGQQAGYGSYNGYAAYGPPQQQAPPPQQQPYPSYGQGYQQAYTQQNYGQAAAAAAYRPAEQQATAQQGYYQGYY